MERYKQGELAPDVAKKANDKLEINPNQKVKQGDFGSESGSLGKKDKVNPAIFRMAEERDY
tara:strand:+ start:623 stop:805 length:183 start_codon:yes stop_codon:yes gene_type:complete